jgi:ribonucleotide reductase beta subunit family protein with ferritin-like domain
MERLQFVNSFAVTGLIALNGIFVQIGTPVQRISRDEIEIHASSAKTVIDYELKTERGVIGFNMIKNEVNAVLNEVLKSEIEFAEVILPNNEVVLGMHSKLLRNNAIWNAQEIYDDYGLIMPYERIAGNPVPELDAWFSSDLTQISPQEQRGGNYLLGGFIRDSASMDLSRLKIDNSRF